METKKIKISDALEILSIPETLASLRDDADEYTSTQCWEAMREGRKYPMMGRVRLTSASRGMDDVLVVGWIYA